MSKDNVIGLKKPESIIVVQIIDCYQGAWKFSSQALEVDGMVNIEPILLLYRVHVSLIGFILNQYKITGNDANYFLDYNINNVIL